MGSGACGLTAGRWRSTSRFGRFGPGGTGTGDGPATTVPVVTGLLLPPLALPPPSPSKDLAAAEPGRIEIALPDGTCVRVGRNVGLVALRRVMAAVRR